MLLILVLTLAFFGPLQFANSADPFETGEKITTQAETIAVNALERNLSNEYKVMHCAVLQNGGEVAVINQVQEDVKTAIGRMSGSNVAGGKVNFNLVSIDNITVSAGNCTVDKEGNMRGKQSPEQRPSVDFDLVIEYPPIAKNVFTNGPNSLSKTRYTYHVSAKATHV